MGHYDDISYDIATQGTEKDKKGWKSYLQDKRENFNTHLVHKKWTNNQKTLDLIVLIQIYKLW